jgi:hypothetical protein
MCGLCGILGGTEDWSGSAVGNDGRTPRAERLHRVRLANEVLRHFGLGLDDWQGTLLLVTSRTGKSELVGSLSELWPAAARMTGHWLDPLDPALIARLEAM